MKTEFKKPAVDLTDLAIGIVVLGIVVSIGSNILVSMQSSLLTDLDTYSTANESADFTTASSNDLANAWFKNIDSVTNASNGVSIESGNYSVAISEVSGVGTISNLTEEFPFDWNVTYTSYNTTSRADYTLTGDAALGLAEYGDWFDIIVIVGIAAVILALIFMAFGGMSNSKGIGGSY